MFEMDAHTGAEVLGLMYMKVSLPLSLASPQQAYLLACFLTCLNLKEL